LGKVHHGATRDSGKFLEEIVPSFGASSKKLKLSNQSTKQTLLRSLEKATGGSWLFVVLMMSRYLLEPPKNGTVTLLKKEGVKAENRCCLPRRGRNGGKHPNS
jgi:hypothetical protein